ncbi:MAG: helix-turn-helix transcriptional regulator [Clostridia bacterium]|nr:helix-turn-helix transcriptional regulator [Clostridia bacterium]
MQNYKKEMGKRIKEKRKELKLTQEYLSEQLGISVKHFSEVERGLAGLSIDNLVKLSSLFDVSLDFLVKGDHVENQWQSTLLLLQDVPEDDVPKIKEIIRMAVSLIK